MVSNAQIVSSFKGSVHYYWNRPNVSYAMYTLDNSQTDEAVKVQTHLISERVNQQECEKARRIQERFWQNRDDGVFLSGTLGASTFLRLDKWYKDLMQDITNDFRKLVNRAN